MLPPPPLLRKETSPAHACWSPILGWWHDGPRSRRCLVGIVNELNALIEAAAAPLATRQGEEAEALEARVAAVGERGSGRKTLEERHKRELRRHRVDELRSGMAVIAAAYRDALVQGRMARPDAGVQAVHRIHEALDALDRNPNETLLLQALLLDLPSV